MRNISRGFTVLELSVAMLILSALSYLTLTFLIRGSQVAARENAQLELEQSTLFVATKLERDLQNSSVGGVSYRKAPKGEPQAVATNPILDTTANGDLVWRDSVVAYVWTPNDGCLYRVEREFGSNPRSEPIRISGNDWNNILNTKAPDVALIAEDVTNFSVQNRSVTGSGRLVDLKLEQRGQIPGLGTRLHSQERVVAFRN